MSPKQAPFVKSGRGFSFIRAAFLACVFAFAVFLPANAKIIHDEKALSVFERSEGVVGKKLANYLMVDQNGRQLPLSFLKGKPTLLTFMYIDCAGMCGSRKRVPLRLIVWLDGKEIISKRYLPAGFHQDGSVFIYEKFIISRGKHTIKAAMRDSKAESDDEFNYNLEETVELDSLRVIVLDFDETEDRLKLI